MRAIITDRCKVWEINDKEGYAEVKFSTSRKVKEDNSYDKVQIDNGVAKNGYISESQSFVRFVGHAYNKLKEIKIGDTITNLKGDLSREPYWDSKNNCIAYPKNLKTTIFEFEIYVPENENNKAPKNLDRAPQVEETNKVSKAPVQPIVEEDTDECPF